MTSFDWRWVFSKKHFENAYDCWCTRGGSKGNHTNAIQIGGGCMRLLLALKLVHGDYHTIISNLIIYPVSI